MTQSMSSACFELSILTIFCTILQTHMGHIKGQDFDNTMYRVSQKKKTQSLDGGLYFKNKRIFEKNNAHF